jgi:hypothetical protein
MTIRHSVASFFQLDFPKKLDFAGLLPLLISRFFTRDPTPLFNSFTLRDLCTPPGAFLENHFPPLSVA